VRGPVAVVGSGFLGVAVASHLTAHEVPATLVARSPLTDAQAAATAGCRVVTGDVRDADVARDALADARHLVWCVGGLLPAEAEADLLAGIDTKLEPLLKCFAAVEPERLVDVTFVSSGGTVYGGAHHQPITEAVPPAPVTAYGIANVAAEGVVRRACAELDARPLILRCGNVYGPGQPGDRSQGLVAAALAAYRSGDAIRMYGDAVRDYLFVDDFAAVTSRLVGRTLAHDVYNVGSGTGLSVGEVLRTVEAVVGHPLRVERHDARACDLPYVVLDTARLRAEVDPPARPFVDGVRAAWAALVQ